MNYILLLVPLIALLGCKDEVKIPIDNKRFRTISNENLNRLHQYNSMYLEYTATIAGHLSELPGACPQSGQVQFEIEDKAETIDLFMPYGRGGQGSLYSNYRVVMKVGEHLDKVLKIEQYISDMQNRDRAALAALTGTGVSPQLYIPDLSTFVPPISRICFAKTIFMDHVPGVSLMNLRASSPEGVLSVAKAAMQLVKKVHDIGLLHGDIHGGNFILEGSNSNSKLTLIDFGRSQPYLDPQGNLIPEVMAITYPGVQMTQKLLSPNELRGKPITRNDDLFRLAETMIAFAIGFENYNNQINGNPLTFKLNFDCTRDKSIPSQVCQLYQMTRSASLLDPPIYAPLM